MYNFLEVGADYIYLTLPFSNAVTPALIGVFLFVGLVVFILRIIKMFPGL